MITSAMSFLSASVRSGDNFTSIGLLFPSGRLFRLSATLRRQPCQRINNFVQRQRRLKNCQKEPSLAAFPDFPFLGEPSIRECLGSRCWWRGNRPPQKTWEPLWRNHRRRLSMFCFCPDLPLRCLGDWKSIKMSQDCVEKLLAVIHYQFKSQQAMWLDVFLEKEKEIIPGPVSSYSMNILAGKLITKQQNNNSLKINQRIPFSVLGCKFFRAHSWPTLLKPYLSVSIQFNLWNQQTKPAKDKYFLIKNCKDNLKKVHLIISYTGILSIKRS